MALPYDFDGEDRQAVDAVKQAVLSGKSRDELVSFEFPFYAPKVGREARRMAKVLTSLDDAQWERLMGVMKPTLHPLGNDVGPDEEEPVTSARRAALGDMLKLYYQDALADRINDSQDTAVGLRLSNRMVSQLELADALAWLGYEHADWSTFIQLRYREGWQIQRIARVLHRSNGTVGESLNDAIDYLIRRIWR